MSKYIKPERSSIDDIIDLYKKDVDRTLIAENLKLTPAQRLVKMQNFINTMAVLKNAYQKNRNK